MKEEITVFTWERLVPNHAEKTKEEMCVCREEREVVRKMNSFGIGCAYRKWTVAVIEGSVSADV